MKVVINRCFGGFSISLDAGRFMAARGNAVAKAEVDEYDAKHAETWFGYGYIGNNNGYKRDDADLVAAVETLGEAANGDCASLKVVEIPDGTDWEISEYDGNEHVAQKHATWY